MVKLPISDYVADYYKKQGIEFTFRQQARFCWSYNDLLKAQLSSLKEILDISDDEKLNKEIRERISYEEEAYGGFMANQNQEYFYIARPDNKDGYYVEYFSSAQNAVSYGTRNSDKEFSVEKCCLSDKSPKETADRNGSDDDDNASAILSVYCFTSDGDVMYGTSYEHETLFDEDDTDRFENLYLYIKSPFGLGDIVMGPDFDCPRVVSTDHDCFEKLYDRTYDGHKERGFVYLDPSSSNIIRTDYVGMDGNFHYDHTVPFSLWKIDSWEDKEYWDILQILSKSIKAGIDMFGLHCLIYKYSNRHR